MWRAFFIQASMYIFDIDTYQIKTLKKNTLFKTFVDTMDSSKKKSIIGKLKRTNVKFDIIIEDASHNVFHQANALKYAVKFLKPNGIMVIEDIFNSKEAHNKYVGEYGTINETPEAFLTKVIKVNKLDETHNIRFINCIHNLSCNGRGKNSIGQKCDWNNDLVLIVVKHR